MSIIIDGGANTVSGAVAMDGIRFPQDAKWPAFHATRSASQTVSASTWTKLQLTTKDFDTASAFDNITNYRFQPTVAGYYQISGTVGCSSSTNVTSGYAYLYKNGAGYDTTAPGIQSLGSAAGSIGGCQSTIMYMNGTTDYVELFGYVQGSGTLSITGAMSGHLLRAV